MIAKVLTLCPKRSDAADALGRRDQIFEAPTSPSYGPSIRILLVYICARPQINEKESRTRTTRPASHVAQDAPGTWRYIVYLPFLVSTALPLPSTPPSPKRRSHPLRTGRRGAGGKRKGPSSMGSTFRLELKRSGHGPAYILEAGRAFRERRSDKGLLPRFGKDLRCQGRSMRAGFRICELCLGELVVSFIDHAWMRFSLGYNRAKARCHTLSPRPPVLAEYYWFTEIRGTSACPFSHET